MNNWCKLANHSLPYKLVLPIQKDIGYNGRERLFNWDVSFEDLFEDELISSSNYCGMNSQPSQPIIQQPAPVATTPKAESSPNCVHTSSLESFSGKVDNELNLPTIGNIQQLVHSSPSKALSSIILNTPHNMQPRSITKIVTDIKVESPNLKVEKYPSLQGNSLSNMQQTPSSLQSPYCIPIASIGHQLSNIDENRYVGVYTIRERQQKIALFRQKKMQQIRRKHVKYICRKRLAEERPRVKGRFTTRSPEQGWECNFISR